jgi:serine/threonine protein kinase
MAPENWSFDENKYQSFYCQRSSDIYSMGVVFWELAEGRGALPWGSSDVFKIRDLVIKELKRPPIPAATPQDFTDVIERCWRDHPMHRPSAADVFLIVQDIATQVIETSR